MTMFTRASRTLVLLALLAPILTACNSTSVRSTTPTPVAPAVTSIPDHLLPDVNIAIFDAGIHNLDPARSTTTPGIRRAEAHYAPQRLKETLLRSEQWARVRVVPTPEHIVDVMVTGTILKSDGESLALEVSVHDARGQHWFTRRYDERISRYAYDMEIRQRQEPFQNVYNRIANDMQDFLVKQDLATLETIRQTSEIRFASQFAPQPFGDYLNSDSNGKHQLKRLPAAGDPLLERVRRIRVRDQMFIDRLQHSYQIFDQSMTPSYDAWREESYAEAIAERELKSQATTETILGALAVIGGILAQGSDSRTMRSAGVAGIAGGAYAVKSGFDKRAQARIHTEAMKELAQSLSAEIQPQTIELTNRTVELTGTAEEQYAKWQQILSEIYLLETGADLPLTTDQQL